MSDQNKITEHYLHGELLLAIQSGLEQMGKTESNLMVQDLAPVDEFHIGGRKASEEFLDQLNISEEQNFFDVGCGLGGTSRFVADRYKCRVSGVDLSSEYVETGNTLCKWLGLENQISLQEGSALTTCFENSQFDGAYMMHVGMNIEDKESLFKEVFRVLRPGALFGIYDVMQMGEGELSFPVPWATSSSTSAVATLARYKTALSDAGFSIQTERNRRDFAIDFFKKMREKNASSSKKPALGLHILMGSAAPTKISNMLENISCGNIAPVELIARKPEQK